MNLQTQINAYCRMARVLELIERLDQNIAISEKYAKSTKYNLVPVIEYHKGQVKRWNAIRDRLIKYGNNLRFRIMENMYLPAYSENAELDLLPF